MAVALLSSLVSGSEESANVLIEGTLISLELFVFLLQIVLNTVVNHFWGVFSAKQLKSE